MAEKNDILQWLQLINTEGVGPVGFKRAIERFGCVEAALKELSLKKKTPSHEWAETEYNRAQNYGAVILLQEDEEYPQSLLKFGDAPPLLYAKGNLKLLNHHPAIAMVGARNATICGRKITSRIAYELTENNFLVISGMARGIDASAHKGALYAKNQEGATIAVLGTGIDNIYPVENAGLYQQIAEQGLIISELPMGAAAQTGNFPRRNRIVAGLADAVLVSEATEKSGSLITAHMAMEQNKTIFAVPGSPGEARSEGPNSLLRRGALWAENANDIIKSFKQVPQSIPKQTFTARKNDLFTKPLDNLQKTADIPPIKDCNQNSILSYLSIEGIYTDEIIRSSGLDAASVAMQLIELEMEDKIIRLPGNKIALSGKNMKVRR